MGKNINDYINKRYNMLQIIKDAGRYRDGSVIVECLCDCGETKNIILHSVIKGKTKSCGCMRYTKYRESMIGEKFNMLTVEEYLRVENQQSIFLLSCDCGNKKEMRLSDVKNGHVKSCGCLNNTLEGLSKKDGEPSKLYLIHRNMVSRCYNKNNIYYNNYGGRGITVCDEWKDDFVKFHNNIVETIGFPKENDTLDRIDNNKGYCIENVKWSNMTEQNSNKHSKYSNTSMKNIYKRGSSYRVKISRYGITVQSHNIKDLDRAKELRDFYVYLFSGTKEECEQLYKEQCYLKK